MTTEAVYGRHGAAANTIARGGACRTGRAASAPRAVDSPVRQFLGATGGQKAVAVEQLVDLTSAVALVPLQRTKYR